LGNLLVAARPDAVRFYEDSIFNQPIASVFRNDNILILDNNAIHLNDDQTLCPHFTNAFS
jgi:hypothetical protein